MVRLHAAPIMLAANMRNYRSLDDIRETARRATKVAESGLRALG
ncbi:hypothetical protein [Nonomuraea phyllanthi]|nr:hypothetical protein [Nonomuraea phyllanthi]